MIRIKNWQILSNQLLSVLISGNAFDPRSSAQIRGNRFFLRYLRSSVFQGFGFNPISVISANQW